MHHTIQRPLAIALAALLSLGGTAVAIIMTPASTGLIAPAAAGDDDETDTTVGGGGGGGGGSGDTGSASGGVGTGLGGTADTFTESGTDEGSEGRNLAIALSALAALGLVGLALRTARSRLGGHRA